MLEGAAAAQAAPGACGSLWAHQSAGSSSSSVSEAASTTLVSGGDKASAHLPQNQTSPGGLPLALSAACGKLTAGGSRVRTTTDETGAVPHGGDDTHNRGSSGMRTQVCERKEARAPPSSCALNKRDPSASRPQPEAQWSPPARRGEAKAAPLSPCLHCPYGTTAAPAAGQLEPRARQSDQSLQQTEGAPGDAGTRASTGHATGEASAWTPQSGVPTAPGRTPPPTRKPRKTGLRHCSPSSRVQETP